MKAGQLGVLILAAGLALMFIVLVAPGFAGAAPELGRDVVSTASAALGG